MITKFRVPIGPSLCGAIEYPFALPLAFESSMHWALDMSNIFAIITFVNKCQ